MTTAPVHCVRRSWMQTMAIRLTPRICPALTHLLPRNCWWKRAWYSKSSNARLQKIWTKKKLKMNKPTTTTILTRLRWDAFFLVLLFLVIQVIPRAFGQRDASKRSLDGEMSLLKEHEMLKQRSAPSAPLEPAVCASWTPTGSLTPLAILTRRHLAAQRDGPGCRGRARQR